MHMTFMALGRHATVALHLQLFYNGKQLFNYEQNKVEMLSYCGSCYRGAVLL